MQAAADSGCAKTAEHRKHSTRTHNEHWKWEPILQIASYMPHPDKIVRSVSVSFVCLLGFKGASTSSSLCAQNFWFKYDNVLWTGLAFLQTKKYFLPLAGFNRQKVTENGKNENDQLAHFTCFWKPVNTSIRNTWCHQAKLTADMPPNVAYHWSLAFSLASLLVQKDDNQPLTRNRTIVWQKSSLKCTSLFIYMSGLVWNKYKKAFDD